MKALCMLAIMTACAGDDDDDTISPPDNVAITGAGTIGYAFPTNQETAVVLGGIEPIEVTDAGSAIDPAQLTVAPAGLVSIDGGIMRGLASGFGTLELDGSDGGVAGIFVYVAPFDRAVAVPLSENVRYATTTTYAWMTGSVDIGIALLDSSNRPLIDTSLAVDGAVQSLARWDEFALHDSGAGHYAVTLETGAGDTAVLDIEVVDHVASIMRTTPDHLAGLVCFEALAADGAFVAGLHWSFALDGVPLESDTNCVTVHTAPGAYTVAATAGGVSIETLLTTN